MNDFDFLSKTTIGQYIPTGSILHHVEPGSKLIGFGILILAMTFSPSIIGVGIGLIASLIGLIIAKIPLRFALKGILIPLPFLIVIALIQIAFFPIRGQSVLFRVGPVQVSILSLMSGLLLILRFSALILAISLMTFCVSASEMIHGLQRILRPLNALGIHTMDFVMIIQIALHFLPLLAQSAERIAKAQASRGAEWGLKSKGLLNRVKQIFPLMIPLFTISLTRAETMALAMDARAYGYKANRTSMVEYSFGWHEAVFLLIVLWIVVLIFIF